MSTRKICKTCDGIFPLDFYPKARAICKNCYNKSFRDRNKAKREKQVNETIVQKDDIIAENTEQLNKIMEEKERLNEENKLLKNKLHALEHDIENGKLIDRDEYNKLVFHISKLTECIKSIPDN